jgi:hypothetical protein
LLREGEELKIGKKKESETIPGMETFRGDVSKRSGVVDLQ